MNQSRFYIQYDNNSCGDVLNETFYEYNLTGPTFANTTFGDWTNISCLEGDVMNQSRSLTQFDIFGCDSNTTFYEYQASEYCNYSAPDTTGPVFTNLVDQTIYDNESLSYDIDASDSSGVSCFIVDDTTNFNIDCSGLLENISALNIGIYWLNITVNDTLNNLNSEIIFVNVTNSTEPVTCSENLENTTWSDWIDESCFSSQMNQSRFMTQYDTNNCGFVNQTIYEYQLTGPDYQNDSSWTDWTNISCLEGDVMNQSRSLTQFDIFGCDSNTTFYEYQASEYCNYSAPDTTGPVFTNLVDQTIYDNESLSYDIDASDSSGVSCFIVDDTTNFNIDCSGLLENISALNIGIYWLNITVNDTLNNLNSGIIFVNVTNSTEPVNDIDGDGIPDYADMLYYNESNVTSSGLTSLNIAVDGNTNIDSSGWIGTYSVEFFDSGEEFMNFTHNFSLNKIDLSKVSIEKTALSIVVNLSGQLAVGEKKTLYLDDNSFVSLCVKDAEIASVSEISASCNGVNEANFTSCLGNSSGVTINSITCYDEGTRIRVENLSYSGIKGTQSSGTSPSGGGGGGGVIACYTNWTCSNWSVCTASAVQTRTCTKIKDSCLIREVKPSEIQVCTFAGEKPAMPVEGGKGVINQTVEENPAPVAVSEKCCLFGICWFNFIFCWYWWVLIMVIGLLLYLIKSFRIGERIFFRSVRRHHVSHSKEILGSWLKKGMNKRVEIMPITKTNFGSAVNADLKKLKREIENEIKILEEKEKVFSGKLMKKTVHGWVEAKRDIAGEIAVISNAVNQKITEFERKIANPKLEGADLEKEKRYIQNAWNITKLKIRTISYELMNKPLKTKKRTDLLIIVPKEPSSTEELSPEEKREAVYDMLEEMGVDTGRKKDDEKIS
jgi:hypothetical protein